MDALPTMHLPDHPTTIAPDGSDVRVLLATDRGSMAHFQLAPGLMSRAVRHRSVEEIWYILSGRGEMWRNRDGSGGAEVAEAVTPLEPGTCTTIPVGTRFQFRSLGPEALTAVAVTMPPWPGPDEAELVEGCPEWDAAT